MMVLKWMAYFEEKKNANHARLSVIDTFLSFPFDSKSVKAARFSVDIMITSLNPFPYRIVCTDYRLLPAFTLESDPKSGT